ncbi:delta(1)-pyrroline-2-carboxylate reductase family protein [Corallococcus sp. H22C18031201]|nr:delta(1)-pyrroline-2-carboxylate reductase family protein [Corallococcus sp. H22C18031201]
MDPVPWLSAAETVACLPYPALVRVLDGMLGELREGRAHAPPRLAVDLPGGTLLVMPATNERVAITKLVTVHTDNPSRGRKAIQAEVLVLDAATGERRLVLDGATVTARRTAAVTLLAAQRLAPRPDDDLLLVGAGVQARAHAEAFLSARGTRRVVIHSRSPGPAEALARHLREQGAHVEVEPRASALPEVLERVGLVVTATTSHAPVLPDLDAGCWRGRHFVAAIGAFRPEMRELPAGLVQLAAKHERLRVDTLFGVKDEAGDLLQAHVDWDRVRALQDTEPLRDHPHAPVVFKSVGYACWDLGASLLALETHARTSSAG